MKKKLPVLLIYSRLLFGILILLLSLLQVNNYKYYAVTFLVLGLLTDIFDGIIARKLNVSNQGLRRQDSAVDQIFFVLVTVASFIQSPQFFNNNKTELIILFGAEAICYIVCFIKFGKEVATHAIASKLWTLLIVATLIQLIWMNNSGILFQICFYAGMITRLEIIAIILLLRNWTNDVPSIYHAVLLRNGKEIKRNKLLNG